MMRLWLVILFLGAAACGGDGPAGSDDDDDVDPPASLSPQQFVAGRARWTCTWAQRCCMKAVDGVDTSDVEACTQALVASSPDLVGALASGGVTFDGAQAAACLDELEASSCDPGSTFDGFADHETCRGVVQGTRQVGGACPQGIECSGVGNICVIYENDSHCTGLLALGAVCDQTDAICDPATSLCEGELPFPRTCVARHPSGTLCDPTNEHDCASGYCDPGTNRCADATSCERL
jgi:hypothetical protein